MIELERFAYQNVLAADGICVAVGEEEFFVIVAQFVYAQPFGLFGVQTGAHGHDLVAHLVAEGGHVFGGVVIALALQIDIVDITVKAQRLRFFDAQRHQLVVDGVQLVRNALVQGRPFLKGLFALGAVGRIHVFE